MTKAEFYSEWLRLNSRFPHDYLKTDSVRLTRVYDVCKDLDKSWLICLVNRIILTNNMKLSIVDAALGEVKSRNDVARTKALIEEKTICYDSLDKHIEAVGAVSLWDAVEKSLGSSNKD